MVDFRKRLAQKEIERPTDPVAIYERLDRASDKGPLRPAQRAILEAWFASHRQDRDLILKLHTGQGKTLIGLLMLQSYLNENAGPVVYVCPNEFLVRQTLEQAAQFGVACVPVGNDGLPADFEAGRKILVVNVQTLFNGKTRFRLGPSSLQVGAVCLDDAHACVDSIRGAFTVTLAANEPAYTELRNLFLADLREQGHGTCIDIESGEGAALLPVPYWAWRDHLDEAAGILAKYKETCDGIKFAWPVVRDILADCLCVVSGKQLQIAPYQPSLHQFGTFDRAVHRIFMSATVADDSFLVRGLGVAEASVSTPLRYAAERWSGEKMILIPSLIDETLDDADIVHAFAAPDAKRHYGVVAICPSFGQAERWKAEGAFVARTGDIDAQVERLRDGEYEQTLVVANRYDGIDLPDDACRILILDSKPRPESLIDRYVTSVREGSDIILQRTTRAIEQGLGRAVRGEKDFCVVILIGPDLVKLVRTPAGRRFLSAQTRLQIDIGFDIAEMARNEIGNGKEPMLALRTLIRQSLRRDDGWKEFYVQQMDGLDEAGVTASNLSVYAAERRAEEQYRAQNIDAAVKTLQGLIDSSPPSDQGWYLQEMARYHYRSSKTTSNKVQIAAHAANPFLLKPQTGMQVLKVSAASEQRAQNILRWMRSHATFEELAVTVSDLVSRLRFGVAADDFERALDELGKALGFVTQRPDKHYKAGPDNLWALGGVEYALFEAKSEVAATRAEIFKSESGQMNNACVWFNEQYSNAHALRFMITPARKLANGAGFNDDVRVMRDKHLRALTKNVRAFFGEFQTMTLAEITEMQVQQRLSTHKLTVKDFSTATYSEVPFRPKP